MENNNISNEEWESLCHYCGKCCHGKYDLGVFTLADPEYVCKYLTDDNRCEIYEDRLTASCHCMALKDAIKETGLLPADCGYLHLNPKHTPFLMPSSMENFWNLVQTAEKFLNKKFEKEINLVSIIKTRRENYKENKSRAKTG